MRTALLLFVVLLGAAACDSGDGDATGATSTAVTSTVVPGPVAATELVAGDCLTGLVIGENERTEIDSASVVGCDQAHELEVFAIYDLTPEDFEATDDSYPGQQRVVSAAESGCAERSDDLGDVAESIGIIAVWPTQQSWTQGDRAVACVAYTISGSFDGQLPDS